MNHSLKIDKLNFIKIKVVYSSKDIIKIIKKQATKWEKILLYNIVVKIQCLYMFISKIHKQFLLFSKS
jgi:hypothetical protein